MKSTSIAHAVLVRGSRFHSSLVRTIALAVPLVALVGCANQAVTRSGFLDDYGTLSAQGEEGKSLSYRRADRAAASMPRTVVIDEVQLRLPREQAEGVPIELQNQARADYRAALERAFAARYRIVPPGVSASSSASMVGQPADVDLHVRAAITGLKPSNPTLNVLTTLLIGPVSNGGVSTESEVVDSRTGERLAAQATYTNGHLFNGGIGGYFDKLGHVRKAFEAHAEKLRDLAADGSAPQRLGMNAP